MPAGRIPSTSFVPSASRSPPASAAQNLIADNLKLLRLKGFRRINVFLVAILLFDRRTFFFGFLRFPNCEKWSIRCSCSCSLLCTVYAFGVPASPPSCCMREKRLATPQCSVILPSRTRITSTVSNWILRPVGAMPKNSPLCVPW
jgi:hypothetical protein